jgi:hypothetical protein
MMENLPLKVGVTVLAVAAATLHLLRPDLRIDSITIVLSVIALLPWLQPLVKSVEGFGIKVELQDLKRRVDEALATATEAKIQTRELEAVAVAGDEAAPKAPVEQAASLTTDEREIIQRLVRQGHFRFRTLQQLGDELAMDPSRLAPVLASLQARGILSPLGKTPAERHALAGAGNPQTIWHIPSAESLKRLGEGVTSTGI